MSYSFYLEIQDIPKLPNNSGRRWQFRWAHQKKWRDLIVALVRPEDKPEEPLTKATLTLTRCSSTAREPDHDNMMASYKGLIDGLWRSGIIADDNPGVIGTPIIKWVKCKRALKKTIIEVEELDDQ